MIFSELFEKLEKTSAQAAATLYVIAWFDFYVTVIVR
jgi:hypothetical protein